MNKSTFIRIIALMLAIPCFSEIKYMEIESAGDIPMISLKKIENLEEIISEYGIKIGYRGADFLIVCAGNTYFRFPMNGYYTISDYKMGEKLSFKNGSDFYEATDKLGFSDSESYYFYKKNRFKSKDDTIQALRNGFQNSDDFYNAQRNGIKTNSDYHNFLAAKAQGFNSTADYIRAAELHFSHGNDYYKAMEAGFHTAEEVEAAANWGFSTFSDYETFLKLTANIDSLCEKNGCTKKDAFILYSISNLKKGGEFSVPALSKKLKEDADILDNVAYALNAYINGKDSAPAPNKTKPFMYSNSNLIQNTINSMGGNHTSFSDCFSEHSLNDFLNRASLEKIGKWNTKSEIFKKY